MAPLSDKIVVFAILIATSQGIIVKQERRYPAAILGWGRRRSRGTPADRSHVDLPLCPLEDEFGAVSEVDESWTQAAFRDFHEMRAGRLPAEQATTRNGEQPLRFSGIPLWDGIRRFFPPLSR